jgi:hypothetical protein
MKTVLFSFAFLLILNAGSSQTISSDSSSYLGQNPPGKIPQLFAPGIISLENRLETYPTFSPDGKEMFFSVVNAAWTAGKILHTRELNGIWTAVDTAVFSYNSYINWESFISPDGNRQFFTSDRPSSSGTDIWMVDRTSDSTWTSPVNLNSPVNSGSSDGSACVTNNGTLYFKSLRGGGIGGSILYRSALVGGVYSGVESLGDIIQTGPGESEPFMASDESYMIFISRTRAGGQGGWDLWICFMNPDSSWTDPVNMGTDINTTDDEYGPRVTADGKYLFFTREIRGNTMDIFWVSSGIIDSLKNKVLSSGHPSDEQNIQIFPNPVNTKINILFGTSSYNTATVRVTNMEGRTIRLETYANHPAVTIDFSGNPKGIYILSINVDGKILYKKIVH